MSTKPKTAAGVSIASKLRKKNAPRTAYSKENPSPHAFQPGQSGNPGGKARLVDVHLSRSLRIVLADRAPDEVCTAMGLPTHSTWSLCLARKLVHMAVRGDLAALVEIRTATEGNRISADLSFLDGGEAPKILEVVFMESNGAGGLRECDKAMLARDATPAPPAEVINGHVVPELPAEVSD